MAIKGNMTEWTQKLLSSLSVIIITDRPSYAVVDCRRPSFSGRRCPLHSVPDVWNELPRHVTSAPVPATSFLAVVSRLIFSPATFPTFCDSCED